MNTRSIRIRTRRQPADARVEQLIDAVEAEIGELQKITQEYLDQHAICAEEEPGEGCPCSTCDAARAILEGGE